MHGHDSWPVAAQNTSCPQHLFSPAPFSENWILATHMAIDLETMLPQPYLPPGAVTPVHSA